MADGIVVGADGGGTKTHLCAVDRSGQLVGFASGGASNWEGVGAEGAAEVLAELLGEVLTQAGAGPDDVVGSAFCLAGVDWPSDDERLRPGLARLGLAGPQVLLNDSFAALRAGLPGDWGCVSVAGTGAVCAGRNRHGEFARSMGVGMGEASGSFTVLMAGVEAVAAAYHHSGPPTELTAMLLSSTGVATVPELFEGLTRGGVALPEDLSARVMAVAADGDEVAAGALTEVGARHGRDLVGVADRLGLCDEELDVVLAGGIHVHGEGPFRNGFSEAVLASVPGARFAVLDAPPVVGAALLALEAAGEATEGVGAQLAEDLRRRVGS